MITPGVEIDLFNNGIIAGAQDILTDGVWAWPIAGAHYVKTYHVNVPAEFAETMRRNQWEPPQIETDELIALYLLIEPEDGII